MRRHSQAAEDEQNESWKGYAPPFPDYSNHEVSGVSGQYKNDGFSISASKRAVNHTQLNSAADRDEHDERQYDLRDQLGSQDGEEFEVQSLPTRPRQLHNNNRSQFLENDSYAVWDGAQADVHIEQTFNRIKRELTQKVDANQTGEPLLEGPLEL